MQMLGSYLLGTSFFFEFFVILCEDTYHSPGLPGLFLRTIEMTGGYYIIFLVFIIRFYTSIM